MPDADASPDDPSKDAQDGKTFEAATESFHAPDPAGRAEDPAAHCQVPPALRDHLRYRLLGLLGAGGMGCVYKARHVFMEKVVALKVINRELLARPEMVSRFLQEVKAAARLAHPNIVQAYDADQAGETHFLVMEYVPGVNLDQVVAHEGPLPVSRACDYARQVALGLQHAFERGVVHRDIKPHNLMVTAEGTIKILDFGLARYVSEAVATAVTLPPAAPAGPARPGTAEILLHASTLPGRPRAADGQIVYTYPGLGTPDYIAPEEILDARRADIRADIYSLGCTLYRLLSGRVPFPARTALEKLRSHLEKAPEPLRELRPEVPPEVARLVQRMMAKDLPQRVQTPAEIAQGLTPYTDVRRRHLLIVDDEADNRDSLALALSLEGYEVSTAANGLEALAHLRNAPGPDVIILDMAMPVMDGVQFLQELKKYPELKAIPVMVLSGAATPSSRAIALGVADYLQKPCPVDELALRIKRYTG